VVPITAGTDAALHADLAHQALDATVGHAQGAIFLTPQQQEAIVDFELGLTTAQVQDEDVGSLQARGGQGGPVPLSTKTFSIGSNNPVLQPDPHGGTPTFNPPGDAFTIDSPWAGLNGNAADDRVAAARGEALFNKRPITISGVAGINDALGQTAVQGTCATCHDTPNVGNHSVSAPLNIGIADASRRTPDMPLYTLVCTSGPLADPAKLIQTTDPGRALITGKCADIGKFKGPVLRGLAARAPYFHNGSAATLFDVVNFYNTRFSLNLSAQEKEDLVTFLRTL
jgi:cytochrome c peroxidase